jgi:hypothetical protein
MNTPRTTTSLVAHPVLPAGPSLSLWSLLGLSVKLALMDEANWLKQRLVAARELELALEAENQRLAGGTLWPSSIAGGHLALPGSSALSDYDE